MTNRGGIPIYNSTMRILNNKMYIFLDRIKFYARHGVDKQETIVGGIFILDLKMQIDFSRALETDDLEHTVSYAEVYEVVKKEMNVPSMLLEHAAGRIAGSLLEHFPEILAIELKLTKQNPPMGAETEGAGVILNVER